MELKMKDLYALLAICAALLLSYVWVYKAAYESGQREAYIEYQGELNAQMQAVAEANKKIVGFQKKIANNNDECFNQLWPDEIVESVNVQLR